MVSAKMQGFSHTCAKSRVFRSEISNANPQPHSTRLSPSDPSEQHFSASDQGISALYIHTNHHLNSLLASSICLRNLRPHPAVMRAKERLRWVFRRYANLPT
eukprot:COSAG02_NODE_150_length_33596_cov_61.953966_23_plen_102_part_00